MNNRYVYQKIEEALKAILNEAPLHDRLIAARAILEVLSEGHFRQGTPAEMKEYLRAFVECDISQDTSQRSKLFLNLCLAAMQPSKEG